MYLKTLSFITSLLLLHGFAARAQMQDLSNSFAPIYERTNTAVQYNYDEQKQIHDYTNNWDLDQDGIKDSVCFVGTGGAHLYFFLCIVLSGDKIVRNFDFLQSDFPVLSSAQKCAQQGFNPTEAEAPFAVFDFEHRGINSIFLRLDEASFLASQKNLSRKGIRTRYVLLSFPKGKPVFKDFVTIP
ncbi:hypothetical protein DBR32_14035 [Taibaiella sp. KBW10]|uniref:hypothetical protein n=1 Tax=Taibaiella sp. KBW10 TaxID=2153357 RepID=UPI000F599E52|nr:hypothetical protein [Taibaiella sp. KBW10]RQO30021.1 hypothetical protein DBR32_14035 [Taibaiella sp. KBW10]